MSLSLISINIEQSKHLDLVIPFLAERTPDVVCIQELFERDILAISEALQGAPCFFVPMTRYLREEPPQVMGVGIFSRLPVKHQGAPYYAGDPAVLPELDQNDTSTFNSKNFPVAYCDVEKEGEIFRIANTHFTWTPDGKPSDLQREHMKKLLRTLGGLGEFVLCGDFNAPRGLLGQGGEIWQELATRYKDNVPLESTSTIDPKLHRAGPLELVVDGIFSTPYYIVSDVELISGVSDHRALVAKVSPAVT